MALGSARVTDDVDIVVLKGSTKATRTLLAAADKFTVERGTLHTHYASRPPVEIEILTPPALFKENFDQNTETVQMQVNGQAVNILHPIALLNAKCGSILKRATDAKKTTDADDINFLLAYLAKNGIFPTSAQLPNVDREFVSWFVDLDSREERWKSIGFDFEAGKVLARSTMLTFADTIWSGTFRGKK